MTAIASTGAIGRQGNRTSCRQLPCPTPLAFTGAPFPRFRIDPAREIAPPLPSLPSGATFRNAGLTVRLLDCKNTDPPSPEAEPEDPPVAEIINSPTPGPSVNE